MKKKIITVLLAAATVCSVATGTAFASAAEDKAAVQAETETEKAELEDGIYSVDFNTDSGMFHVNESCEGKGILTVEDGKMMLHVTLTSKNIVNLFVGLKEDTQKPDAEILEPTVDEVTYSDGYEEEVFGFDIPVTVLDEEFDLALVGKKGKWYDHKVSISNPEKIEDVKKK